jgi:hypothetical protein
MTTARRRTAFAVLLAVSVAGIVVAVAVGVHQGDLGTSAAAHTGALAAAEAKHERVVLFRDTAKGTKTGAGELALAPVSAPGRRTLLGMRCDRAYFAGGRGLCITRGSGFAAGYKAEVFDSHLNVLHSVGLTGIPSRARVSADGRYGSTTFFQTGHSYASSGAFSTATTLIDMRTGHEIANLEDFTTADGSKVITAVDVNYWGVTFAPGDSDRFYATLATGGKTYLIEGSVKDRQAHVLRSNVECPSLSPDGTRIAFKKRTGSQTRPWHLTVLDLATMRETSLSEPRSVDDQAAWLDDQHVLYNVDGPVWEARADGTGRPQRYLATAESPAAVSF